MTAISTIFYKQLIDTLKNKAVLIQYILFPIMSAIMEHAIRIEGMPEHFFAKLFSVMFLGMAPLVSTSAILAEEKEQGTLRALLMSSVHPIQYLLGVGSYVFLICMAGALSFAICCEYKGIDLFAFLLVMSLGILISILFGASIGISAKNQMAATSLTVPAMMLFSFLPMLAMFNETIAKFAKYFYSQQALLFIQAIGHTSPEAENLVILLANLLLASVLFVFSYSKTRLS